MKYNAGLDLYRDNTLAKMLKWVKPGALVLEFGPGNGRMTKYMKEELNCQIYAVEIDPEAAKDCLPYTEKILTDDIESYEWLKSFQSVSFDCIIFADVLEHLHDPAQVLLKASSLLQEDGAVLVSVPNLAHNSVLLNLFNNKFEYTTTGLLDNTHIHFFTYHSLIKLFAETGLVPVVEDACYSEVGQNEVNAGYHEVEPALQNILRQRMYGNVYQYIFKLRKKEHFLAEKMKIRKRIKPNHSLPYFSQLYFDTGGGFAETDCYIQTMNDGEQQSLVVDISDLQNLRAVRIDPADIPVLFCCRHLSVADSEGRRQEISLAECLSNADYSLGDHLIFCHSDSQIYIRGEKYFQAAAELRIDFTARDLRPLEKYFAPHGIVPTELNSLQEKINCLTERNDCLERENQALKNSLGRKIKRYLLKKLGKKSE